jgi:hypothetical protein
MFPKARKVLSQDKLYEIGTQIQNRKQDLQSGLLARVARTAGAALGTVMNSARKD